tara:strand:+ start:18 stop:875 length:858 start_codon:yes stop_codon:yes gene_type:complete
MKKKIIGLLCAYGKKDWVNPSLNQALNICDEVIINVGLRTPKLKILEDETLNEIKKFHNSKIKLFQYEPEVATAQMGGILQLKHMLKNSNFYKYDNWVWMLDLDEFYKKEFIEEVNDVINNQKIDWIKNKDYMFFINKDLYLRGKTYRIRLYRIKLINLLSNFSFRNQFRLWGEIRDKKTYIAKNICYHYSFLTSNLYREKVWENEYADNTNDIKLKWFNEFYKNYEINNPEKYINENYKRFNIKSVWYNNNYEADRNGDFFKFNDQHPSFFKNSKLFDIEDFRK